MHKGSLCRIEPTGNTKCKRNCLRVCRRTVLAQHGGFIEVNALQAFKIQWFIVTGNYTLLEAYLWNFSIFLVYIWEYICSLSVIDALKTLGTLISTLTPCEILRLSLILVLVFRQAITFLILNIYHDFHQFVFLHLEAFE